MFYAAIFFTTLALLFLLGTRKPAKFPPGPKWFPIVGSAVQLSHLRLRYGMFCKAIDKLAERYVNSYGFFGLKIGRDKVVIAYTHDAIKEMLTNEDIDGRPDGIFYRMRTFNKRLGVLLTDGDMWVEQRRFILRHLKNFGFARSGMMDIVHNEAACLLQDLRKLVQDNGGGPTLMPMHDMFSVYVLNTLWCMLMGYRFERGSPAISDLIHMFFELFKNIDMVGALFSHFPLLRFVAPHYSGYTGMLESHKALYAFMGKEIERHRSSYRNYDTPRDLMDSYLRAQEESSNEHSETFSDESLLAVCLDMFLAGSETTNKSLGFCFLHLVRQPQIQERAYAEIKEVVGLERLPEWSDRPRMPYCEGITMEALRMFMAHTFSISHRATCDTRLSGFRIPKDTMVLACFRGMFTNPKDFPEPDVFDPMRYIVDGQIKLPEAFNPFGFGRRRCMGDLLGRQNLFMFTTSVLQNFRLEPLPGQLPDDVPLDGATAAVKPYDALLVPRAIASEP